MKKFIAIVAVMAVVAVAGTASAANILVTNSNTASVSNNLSASSVTGGNTLMGAASVGAVTGGNVTNSNYANHAGNGALHVQGGHGGEIRTGNATALAEIGNDLNSNDTNINATPWSASTIAVTDVNNVGVANTLGAGATTGGNAGVGGVATFSVNGGNIDLAGASNVAGNTGGAVHGGNGGLVVTGHSASQTSLINVLNRNITRVQN
jgi:hypothetical protein